jgi:hypothetical protein
LQAPAQTFTAVLDERIYQVQKLLYSALTGGFRRWGRIAGPVMKEGGVKLGQPRRRGVEACADGLDGFDKKILEKLLAHPVGVEPPLKVSAVRERGLRLPTL